MPARSRSRDPIGKVPSGHGLPERRINRGPSERLVAIETVCVRLEQYLDAVARPLGNLGRADTGVESCRDGRMP